VEGSTSVTCIVKSLAIGRNSPVALRSVATVGCGKMQVRRKKKRRHESRGDNLAQYSTDDARREDLTHPLIA
jgi:hypothetical protein